jgi:hypothetical protein
VRSDVGQVFSVYTSDINTLRSIASEICSKYGALCFAESDPEDLLWFSFIWAETFYYADPEECTADLECLDTLFDMQWEIFKLAANHKYAVYISRELLEEAVTKLLKLTGKG